MRATEEGRAAIAQSPSPLQDRLADALSRLSELEQSPIARVLEQVCQMMEAQDIKGGPIFRNPTRPGTIARAERVVPFGGTRR